jgi:pimeloyl-ACP methyl ester carboxylesterase
LKRSPRIFRLIFFALLPAVAAGCNNYVAGIFVRAPNGNLPIRGQDAPDYILAQHHVAQQLRFNVGPPDASLSVWIVNAVSAPTFLSLVPGPSPRDMPVPKMTLIPQTQPTVTADRPPKGTVFFLHGLDENKEDIVCMLYSYALACEGYRVVLVDLRGHGRSTGDHIGYGGYEAHDLTQILDDIESRGLVSGNVAVMGVSYGASVGICWASVDPRVKAVVALEPFSSLRFASQDAGATMLMAARWMFSKNDIQDITNRVGRIDGFDPDRASPLYAISHMKTPVLLIHGKLDDFLYPEHSIRLHEAAPDHSRLILVDGADHFDLWLVALNMIMTESNEWFEHYMNQ